MPTVVAMLADPADRRLTTEQVGRLATVRFCDTVEALVEVVEDGGIDAVVADLHDVSGTSILPTFRMLHRRAPQLPLVLFCLPTPEAIRELPLSGAVVRGFSLVFRNYEHLGLALAPVLRPLRVPSAAETLARHLVPLVPGPFRPFVLVCALKASPRLKVGTAATWSGASRRTLERSLRRARLPSAASVLGSCTALHAVWWLDVQGWSTKHVVTKMQFSHASALIRLLQGHFGCSLRSVRQESGFHELLSQFELTLLGDAVSGGRIQSR
jgi:AraC-like DNA-binding protein